MITGDFSCSDDAAPVHVLSRPVRHLSLPYPPRQGLPSDLKRSSPPELPSVPSPFDTVDVSTVIVLSAPFGRRSWRTSGPCCPISFCPHFPPRYEKGRIDGSEQCPFCRMPWLSLHEIKELNRIVFLDVYPLRASVLTKSAWTDFMAAASSCVNGQARKAEKGEEQCTSSVSEQFLIGSEGESEEGGE